MGKPSSQAEQKAKVTLNSGKSIVLKRFTIKLKNQAIEAAGAKCGENTPAQLFQSLVADEALKLMIDTVDGKPLDAVSREDLDTFLSFDEYQSLASVVGDFLGTVQKKPKIELIMQE